MKTRLIAVLSLLAALLVSINAPAQAASAVTAACPPAAPGHARCLALVRTGVHPMAADGLPAGFGPADLDAAYNLPIDRGAGQTIGIVDAFDDPSAEADLAVYRSTFGLPPCTTDNGCFAKVNQQGVAGSYPDTDPTGDWELEESLDLDMVSAACPNCNILLVEGNSDLVSDLAASVDTAVSLGADVVSNSYGLDEFNGMQQFFGDYQHSGHVIVASSGDFGFGPPQFPAVAPGVLAVGGTSLHAAPNSRGWFERAWPGAGSGCSAYVTKPGYQHRPDCKMRSTADVSADADPNNGVAVYDTSSGDISWFIVGGTSASSPLIAAVIGLAGNASTYTPAYSYSNQRTSALFDVTTGSNGSCGGGYLCTAVKGYDGPTGLGSPDGIGAF